MGGSWADSSSTNQRRVASYLRQQADSLGNRVLSALATSIESDTVSMVKKMIKDLHKCRSDTELSTNIKLIEDANRKGTISLSSLSMPTLMNWMLSGRQQDSKAGH